MVGGCEQVDWIASIFAGACSSDLGISLLEFVLGLVKDLLKFLTFGVLLAWIIQWIFSYLPSRVRWGLKFNWKNLRGNSSLPVIVLASVSGANQVDYKNLHTDIGQVRSAAAITPSILKAYRVSAQSASVVFSEDPSVAALVQGRDIVTVGGAKNNEISLKLISALPANFTVATVDSEVNLGQKVDVPIWDGEPKFSSDKLVYGFIARFRNPLDSERFVTLIAGAGAYGTEAAALALANDKDLLKWLRKLKGPSSFVALVSAGLQTAESTAYVQGVQLIEAREFPGVS